MVSAGHLGGKLRKRFDEIEAKIVHTQWGKKLNKNKSIILPC
jgi:hypothetical protein